MADDQKILKLIEQTATEDGTRLYLSNNALMSLPLQGAKLTNLTSHTPVG